MMTKDTKDEGAEFVFALAQHERTIHKFILTLLPHAGAAQEVFQETLVVLWKKREEFLPGSNFLAWACRVAHFEVLKFRQTARRDRLRFDEELINQLADDRLARQETSARRQQALGHCLQKLKKADRDLIRHRYEDEGLPINELAARLGKPVATLYKNLARIRQALFLCISKQLAAE